MVYADYDFYKNDYFGRAVSVLDFPRLALRASQYIDYITQGRAEKKADIEAVRMCCCEMAERYQTIDAAQELAQKSLAAANENETEVQSETVGSWSRSYRSGGESAHSAAQAEEAGKAALYAIAQRHLARTGLLYRGGGCFR